MVETLARIIGKTISKVREAYTYYKITGAKRIEGEGFEVEITPGELYSYFKAILEYGSVTVELESTSTAIEKAFKIEGFLSEVEEKANKTMSLAVKKYTVQECFENNIEVKASIKIFLIFGCREIIIHLYDSKIAVYASYGR